MCPLNLSVCMLPFSVCVFTCVMAALYRAVNSLLSHGGRHRCPVPSDVVLTFLLLALQPNVIGGFRCLPCPWQRDAIGSRRFLFRASISVRLSYGNVATDCRSEPGPCISCYWVHRHRFTLPPALTGALGAGLQWGGASHGGFISVTLAQLVQCDH